MSLTQGGGPGTQPLLFNPPRGLFAHDVRTGELLWQRSNPGVMSVIGDPRIFLVQEEQPNGSGTEMLGLLPSGEVAWRRRRPVGDDQIYFGFQDRGSEDIFVFSSAEGSQAALLGIDARTGRDRWSARVPATTSAALIAEHIYVADGCVLA